MFLSRKDVIGLGRRSGRAVSSTIDANLSVGRADAISGLPLLLLMAAAVFLLRLPFINFSVLSDDESVYFLVGQALRHGALPYVDIIDRKPLGIYLIYAFADWTFGDAVIGARLLGAFSTFGAAVLLKWFGERALGLSQIAGAICGLLYATYALLFFGDAAQTPVFFMPLVIAAGGLVIMDLKRVADGVAPNPWRLGWAGLLLGLSLQVKYSTVVECGMWGVLPLIFAWRERRALGRKGSVAVLAGAGLMLLGGLLPTAIAYAVYVALGHGDTFVFYNFTVNLQRGATQYSSAVIMLRGSLFLLAMSPLAVMAYRFIRTRGVVLFTRAYDNRRWVHAVLVTWTVAAIAAGLMQRQPFSHYFFDALAPFSLLAAAALHWASQRQSIGRTTALLFALAIVGYIGLRAEKIVEAGSPYLPQRIADEVRDQGARSMYVFNSAGIIYHLADVPLPTRYPHPPMLTSSLEGDSFAIDGPGEIKKVLAQNPEAVVLQQPISPQISADRQELVLNKLAHDYCLWRIYDAGYHRQLELYLLRKESQLACALSPAAAG
jgi:hypothetical protein